MILVTGASRMSSRHLEKIRKFSNHEVVFLQQESGMLPVVASKIEAVLCNSLFSYHPENQFSQLKLVQATSAGLDRIPVKALTLRGVQVKAAQNVYSPAIAEFVLLLILQIYKKSAVMFEQQQRHVWIKQRKLKELTDLTACIVGYGSIGREVAARLKPFGVKINPIGRNVSIDQRDEALSAADIVILSAPLTTETYHLMNRSRLSSMRKGSVLINVSRGKLVDETALIDLLSEGHFEGVGLDVFEDEPLSDHSPLWDDDRVIVTPHNSFVSDKSTDRLMDLFLENLGEII